MKYKVTPPSSVYLFGTSKQMTSQLNKFESSNVYCIDGAPELDEAVKLAEEYMQRVENSRKITAGIIQKYSKTVDPTG